jgi:hypothetical protein
MANNEKCMVENPSIIGFMRGNFNDDEQSIWPNPLS